MKLLLTHVNDTEAKYLLVSVEKLAVTRNFIQNLYELRKLLLTYVNDTKAKYLLVSVEKLAVTRNFEDLLRKLSGVSYEEAEHDMCIGCRCVNSWWISGRVGRFSDVTARGIFSQSQLHLLSLILSLLEDKKSRARIIPLVTKKD
nr:hypothetical protein [Tanacetum cinerariifolium]